MSLVATKNSLLEIVYISSTNYFGMGLHFWFTRVSHFYLPRKPCFCGRHELSDSYATTETEREPRDAFIDRLLGLWFEYLCTQWLFPRPALTSGSELCTLNYCLCCACAVRALFVLCLWCVCAVFLLHPCCVCVVSVLLVLCLCCGLCCVCTVYLFCLYFVGIQLLLRWFIEIDRRTVSVSWCYLKYLLLTCTLSHPVSVSFLCWFLKRYIRFSERFLFS